MKNKIALRLTIYFAAALLIFALVVGSSFRLLFWQQTETLKKQELEQRAVKIAQALADTREQMLTWQERMEKRQMAGERENRHEERMNTTRMPWGYGSMLRFLSSSAADDVWVVDPEHNLEVRTGPTSRAGRLPIRTCLPTRIRS